jgi:dienelactone hydrolase
VAVARVAEIEAMRRWAALGLILVLLAMGARTAAGAEQLVQVAPNSGGPNGTRSDSPLLGYLLQPNDAGPYPAIVVLHGCEGFHLTYVILGREFQAAGYVVLVLDSLGGGSFCKGGGGAEAEALDAYAALGWLNRQPFVDPARVGVVGFSMGGVASLMVAAQGGLAATFPQHFRAAVAYYPRCRWSDGVMAVPTLVLIGGSDDWAPAADCEAMMQRRADQGAPVTLQVFPGATHAFNSPAPPHFDLGHFIQFDARATTAARQQALQFLQAQLGPN